MVDRLFAEPRLAALYDAVCAGRADFGFYLPLVTSADSVLDVGCGTGELLRMARASGHRGRLCGVDPAPAMLAVARQAHGIEWVLSDVPPAAFDDEFDLVVMTGHAFQVFLDDDETRRALSAIRAALRDGGRFVFETRNPAAREWEGWIPADPIDVVTADGLPVRMTRDDVAVERDVVSFTLTFTSPAWPAAELSRSRLRFVDHPTLRALLHDCGFVIEQEFGDWDRQPATETSPEIIVVARR